VTLCVVCTVHEETRARISWLSLKIKVDGFSVCASKSTAPVW
jgi:hypothetical protein